MTDVLISTSNTQTNRKETYMSRFFKVGVVGLLVVGALAVVLAGSALAQEPTPPDPLDKQFGGWGRGGFGRFGGDRWSMFDTTAEVLGLTPEELFAELHAGKTLSEVIEKAVEDGALTQEQADRMLNRLENMPTQEELVEAKKQAIQQALDEERISQGQYDWLMQGLENGYLGGPGCGGRGFHKFGGFRGMGDFDGNRGPSRPGVSGISL
jgi:polyhydroxyalkanoate synthesis regulator phasin